MRERACVGLGLAMFVLALGAPASGAPGDPATPVAHYEAPAPVRIYRFHVYSTMKARWKKKATKRFSISASSAPVAAWSITRLLVT